MTRILAALCAIAPVVPLIVDPFDDYNPVVIAMSDGMVQTRLAATAAFTGGALLWFAVLAWRGLARPFDLPTILWIALGLFVVVNVLATLFAEDWRASIVGERLRYQGMGATLLYVLLFGVAAYAVRSLDDLRVVLRGLFVGAVIAAGYALVQRSGLDWISWAGRELDRPASVVGQTNTFAAFLVLAINASVFLLPPSASRWRSALPWLGALAAGWLVVVVVVLAGVSTGLGAIAAIIYTIVLAELAIAFSGTRVLADTAILAGMIAMVAALVFTISRSGYLAMLVALMIWSVAGIVWFAFIRRGRQPEPLGVAAIAAGAVAATVAVAVIVPLGVRGLENAGVDLGRYGERIEASTDFDTSEISTRRSLWSLAWQMTLDRPLLGYGQDGFSIMFPAYRDRETLAGIQTGSLDPESAHNALLDISSGTGFLGLASFIFLIGTVFVYGTRTVWKQRERAEGVAVLALISACTAYLVAVTLGFTEAITTWAFWLLLGALAGLAARGPAQQPSRAPSRALVTSALPVGLATLGLIALVWAATFTAANLSSGQARSALEDGKPDAALRLARRAASLDPLERAYLLQKGDAYGQNVVALGNEEAFRRAMETYRTALTRFAPESTAALQFALARQQLYQVQGRPLDETWEDLEYAVSLDPFNACLRRFVADVYLQHNELERALKHTVMIRYFAYRSLLPECARFTG
jgi:hypothetical protein